MKSARTLSPDRVAALAAEVSARFAGTPFALTPIEVECSRPVFRAEAPDKAPMFVKVTSSDEAVRNLRFLRSSGSCALLPKPLLDEPFDFDGRAVVCLEWKSGRRLEVEDMTDAEADSFLSGVVSLSVALRSAPDVQSAVGEDTPDGQFATVADYARRHPLVARLLRPLTDIPVVERSYAGRTLAPIHGDFHSCNYGFEGGRLAAVFDFDAMVMGLPCEDAAYPFTESIRQHGLPDVKRARLRQTFRRLVRASPWPLDDWRVAVNHARLRIAANRIRKHPRSFLTAFDVEHRDREVRPLLAELS